MNEQASSITSAQASSINPNSLGSDQEGNLLSLPFLMRSGEIPVDILSWSHGPEDFPIVGALEIDGERAIEHWNHRGESQNPARQPLRYSAEVEGDMFITEAAKRISHMRNGQAIFMFLPGVVYYAPFNMEVLRQMHSKFFTALRTTIRVYVDKDGLADMTQVSHKLRQYSSAQLKPF